MRKLFKCISATLAILLILGLPQAMSLSVRAAALAAPTGYYHIESTDFETAGDIFSIASTASLENAAGNNVAPTNVETSVGTGADANATRKLRFNISGTGNRHCVKTISAATRNAVSAAEETLVSFDWYPGTVSNGRGEIRLVNGETILLSLVNTTALIGYHSGTTGTGQAVLPTGFTSRTQWYTVNIYLRKGSTIKFDIKPKNNTGSTYSFAVDKIWDGAFTSIQLQGLRTSGTHAWETYIDNIGIYEREEPDEVKYSASANGSATSATTEITLALDTAIANIAASNIVLTPAGSAIVGAPVASNENKTWTVPVTKIIAGEAAVAIDDVSGFVFLPNVAGAEKVNLYAGTAAKYAVSANGSSTATTSSIAITFNVPITGLTAGDITLTPANAAIKGALTGSGASWSLAVSEAKAGDVTVSIKNIPDFAIEPTTPGTSDKTALFKRPPDAIKFTAAANGDANLKEQTSKIDLTFDTAITGLTADAIEISPGVVANKGALTGSGTSWSLALSNIAYTSEVAVSIADFSDYTFSPLSGGADKALIIYVKPPVAFTGNEWTTTSANPFIFQIGGENARSNYYLYDTEAKAKENFTLYPFADEAGTISNSANILPLNGTWKFKFAVNPAQRPWPTAGIGQEPRDFNLLGFDASSWDDITVPNSWQVNFNADGTAKYDQVEYVNSRNAWQYYASGNTTTAPAAPTNYNGVGTYQRHFTLPEDWIANKQVFLNFDGVSGCYIWINGQAVGWTTDIWTHHEFDATPYLKAGDNVIALQLIRWTSGSWLENQDMIRLSGIARKLYFMARNKEDIWDFEVSTKPVSVDDLNNGRATAWTFGLKTSVRDFADPVRLGGESKMVHYKLYDADGALVAEESKAAEYKFVNYVTSAGVGGVSGTNVTTEVLPFGVGVRYTATPGITGSTNISLAIPEFTATLASPHLWSSEDPYLYKLVMYVENGAATEYASARIGFKHTTYVNQPNAHTLQNGVYVASSGSYWLVNGKRVTFYGANIHEINPEKGYTMTLDLIRKDEELMKLNNVNAIRMAHYPHDTRYYDVADELGIYVLDEANHESHNSTGNSTATYFMPTLRDRMLNMFERDKNMACVVAWSAGNESAMSTASAAYSIWILKARENEMNGLTGSGGRPTHAQYGQAYADMWAGMYPSYGSFDGTGEGKIMINCEFSHAMGNSLGNMDTYVAIAEGNSYSAGGFIWDWVDQSIKTPVPPSATVEGVRGDKSGDGTFYGYDGDWGNNTGDLDFCANGVILASREAKPEAAEVKRLYQRLKVTANGTPAATSVGYTVKNSFMHTNANSYEMTWQLYENGTVIREGVGALDVDPEPYAIANAKNTAKSFEQDFAEVAAKPGAEYFFNIQFRLKEDTSWAKKGYVVAENQLPLTTGGFAPIAKPVAPIELADIKVEETEGTIQITGDQFSYKFDKATGSFSDMSYKGRQFATIGFEPNFYMPVTDNQVGEAVSGGANGSATTEILRWKNTGANRTLASTTYSVATTFANYVEIVITSANTSVDTQNVTITTTYKIYPTGEVNVSESYVFGASASAYANVVGGYLKLVPGMENITYFARGPEENYVDRKTGTDVGVYQTTVSENYAEYITSQDTGERLDTRWAAVTDDTGFGVVMKAGQFDANSIFTGAASAYNPAEAAYNMASLVEFNALHYSPTQFGDARSKHPYQVYDEFGRNDEKLPTYLYVNVASRGRGADTSWGTQARPKGVYLMNIAGKTVKYNFSILPVDNFDPDSAMTFSKTQHDAFQNVKNLLPIAAAAGVLATNPAYVAAEALESTATELESVNVYNALFTAASLNTLAISQSSGVASASILLDSAPPEGAKVIIAFYDDQDKLVGVADNIRVTNASGYVQVQTELAVPADAAKVKAFYWDEKSAPLALPAQALIE